MYERILAEFFTMPWAIQPEKLAVMTDLLLARSSGHRLSAEDVQARIGAGSAPEARQVGAVAVIPVYGVIAQRMDLFSEMSGGVSTDRLAKQIRQAVDDPGIGAIALDMASPGGSVYGVQELGDVIYNARGTKKIVAVANSYAASAAYWLASQADELVVTPGGEVGSIGVVTAHSDYSKFYEMTGIKTEFIFAGKYKVEGNPYEPLPKEARDFTQKRVDEYYDAFVKAVARGRGATAAEVRAGYGQARMLGAKEAVSENMADKVETLDDVIVRLSSSKRAQSPRRRAAAIDLAERI